jgi:ubiquinone/menaquinone biosynthesis C-methylase UbiE
MSSFTIDAYNKYADIYDQEVIYFWENFPKEFVDKFVSSLPGKRILNLGSGSGRDALILREAGLDVVCLDASKSMIDITTSLGFESHLADFSEINFSESSFDGVWAYTSLIHIPQEEVETVIKHTHKLLVPQGILAVGVIEGEGANTIERRTMPGVTRYFKYYNANELKEMVQRMGFAFSYEQLYVPHRSVYINQIYRRMDN